MIILADEALPNAEAVFREYGEVWVYAGRAIQSADLKDVDILITRSITKVNADLLKDAPRLKFCGTATAGLDHYDLPLLNARGILYDNAAGSNKESVGDYILSVLLVLQERHDFSFAGKSIGIIGCGNVGSQVELKARALGLSVVKNDPPRLAAGALSCAATLDDALSCDIVSLHVPLEKEGPLATYHLLDEERLRALKPHAIILNASRGSVVDNAALLKVLKERPDLMAWCDVFEGEPDIKVKELLPCLEGATAHIAGYSYESKRRATVMLARSMAKALNLEPPGLYAMPEPEIETLSLKYAQTADIDLIRRLVFAVYDVRRDSHLFKNRFKDGASFDLMRKNYRERRELSSLRLTGVSGDLKAQLIGLGFSVE